MTRRRKDVDQFGETLDLFAPGPAPRRAASSARRSEPPRAPSARRVEEDVVVPPELLAAHAGDAAALAELAELADLVEADPYQGGIPGATRGSAVAVSTLTQTVKEVVEGAFVPLWVRGEVSDFKAHRNGHWYFCLRDQVAQIRCVIWARDARRLPAPPDDGMQVVALGMPGVYAARADLQFVVKELDAQGDGLWRKALERTRAALDADGLLDVARKRRLPLFPRRVAVVTSPDGAALHDIAVVVRRRCPSVELVVVPAKVQGDGAAEELRAAVERVGRWGGADVVIIGRGGGAREDLWAFNDERLARAVAACPVPTISAVGHEVDVTICDLVADVRAATPSVAAETAVPVLADLKAGLRALGGALAAAAVARTDAARRATLDVRDDLVSAASRLTERRRASVESAAGRLHALSPLATLARGYAVARSAEGRTLSRVADFAPAAPFELLVSDGRITAVTTTAAEEPA